MDIRAELYGPDKQYLIEHHYNDGEYLKSTYRLMFQEGETGPIPCWDKSEIFEIRSMSGELEELFWVSEDGKVFSKRTKRLLKQTVCATGYYTVATKIGGRKGRDICLKVHREVAKAFIPGDHNLYVNHIDCDKLNNEQSNLEWVTHQENMEHAKQFNRFDTRKGFDCPASKLTPELCERIDELSESLSNRKIAKLLGLGKDTVRLYLNGERYHK